MQLELIISKHAREVANLHMQAISTGFISSLGIRFVTSLYKAIAENRFGFGFVARQDGQILGFVAFTENINELYKSILRKRSLRFIFLLAGKMFSWTRIKRVFETLLYPGRIKHMDLPSAELLSIAVVNKARGKDVATQLIQKGLKECARREMNQVKVLVAAENGPANKLYSKCGFELVGQIINHNVPSNIYVRQIAQ